MPPTIVSASPDSEAALTTSDCLDILGRVCFGHLAFSRGRHVGVIPVRYALHDGWAYFRADSSLRDRIARSPWLCLSITELREDTLHISVVVRGACYPAEGTGSEASDAAALQGIVALRDRAPVGPATRKPVDRRLSVFRLHAEELEGSVTVVPCPAGLRPYDDRELDYLRTVGREHTHADDSRADDDGMAAPEAPAVINDDAPERTR
jgi:nitroimidazol reductase NimA-like FMN-containing flavoprotein (pyridoxamine 5'-phosphate oxidase superfamily)